MAKIEISQHDREILDSYFQMVGYCRATTGLSFNSDKKNPANLHIVALMIRLHRVIEEMEAACQEATNHVQYE